LPRSTLRCSTAPPPLVRPHRHLRREPPTAEGITGPHRRDSFPGRRERTPVTAGNASWAQWADTDKGGPMTTLTTTTTTTPDPTTPDRSPTGGRWAALAGVGAVVAIVAALGALGDVPRIDQSASSIVPYWTTHSTEGTTAAYLL